MKVLNKTIEIQTKGLFDFIDITDKVKDFIKESQIKNGLVNIQILHTSAGLIVNENEPLLINDFKKNLEMFAPKTSHYQHDNFSKRTVNLCKNECINGHSHCKAIRLLVNTTLNLIEKEIQLGRWQRIFIVELDRSRKRKAQIQILGI
ncbi:secondary thiamine-phosphate synthase enzyme YjbQ [Patescibacteria group bacterium]|nr:secondary thiamine-phosphate synthase enzyme YjbQ [Patescibacteria group bacterium]